MKNCKHCYSEIHQRAKICPQCLNQLSLMGGMKSFLLTAFPILTALVSLGFAFYEKYEKGIVEDSLAQTENRLVFAEVQNEVAGEAIESLASRLPRVAAMERADGPLSGPTKTREQQVREIEERMAEGDWQKLNGKSELRKLMKQKIELEADANVFPSAR